MKWLAVLLLQCIACMIPAVTGFPLSNTTPTPSTFSTIHTGLQVLITSTTFQQDGILDHLSVKVQGPDSSMALQIWRPAPIEGNFHLHWYINNTGNSFAVKRVENVIRYQDPIGVPVRKGDMLGFHIYPSPDPISVIYQEVEENSEVFYIEGLDYPLCELSICNRTMRSVANISPSIEAIVKDLNDDGANEKGALFKLSLHQKSTRCSSNTPIPCPATTVSPTNADTTERQETSGSDDHTTDSRTMIPRRNLLGSGSGDGIEVATDSGGTISSAAIAFIVVGVIFFIVLVILLFILFACLCPMKTPMKKMFLPVEPNASANQNNASGNPEQSRVLAARQQHQNPAPSSHRPPVATPTGDHTYANADVTQISDFRPFTPLYMNSDDESLRELLSEKGSHFGSRTREGRGWSVESSHCDRIHHGPPVREVRGWSAGAAQKDRIVKNAGREVRGWSVEVSQGDRVGPKYVREGRGWSAGPSQLERTQQSQQNSQPKFKRGWSFGRGEKSKKRNSRKLKESLSEASQQDRVKASNFQEVADPRERRAKSVSATSRFKVDHNADMPRVRSYTNHLSTVLSKPLPLPPFSVPPPAPLLKRSNPQLSSRNIPPPDHTPPPPLDSSDPSTPNTDRVMLLEASGDYTSPVPVSERYKYDPKLRNDAEISSMHAQPFFVDRSHDYSDPDEPEDDIDEPGRYDHLSPTEVDVHPEIEHKHSLSDLAGLREETVPSKPDYQRGYVPTEEQRRMMQLQHGGHYEIDDEIDTRLSNGYDRLNYFKETETYWAPAATTEDLYTQLSEYKYREISRREISVQNSIGSGHFGTVRKGVWANGKNTINVAIKTVKNSSEQERIKLLQEAAIMGQFAQNYVVRLLGVVTVGEPVLVILEYMQKGDLHSFLQKLHPKVSNRELPDVVPKLFVKFSKDIANGMSYLAKKCFIHRDLAARNILLNDELTCKIGDFGMARDVESEGDYYKSHGGIIPVKWTAPEALHYNKYSSASDVWSYGMVLFEIWSLGEKPFNELSNPIVIALVSSKHCQPPPPGCPRPIYHLMVECWNPDQFQRPTFESIYDYLESPEESLLYWHSRDIIPDKLAHKLGAPLGEANNLYLDLQRTYQKPLIS